MKREIKFRAWLNVQKEMLYEDLFGAEKFGGRDCEIMQFTGLKDKNGKEIYEGDIVAREQNPMTDDTGYYEEVIPELQRFFHLYGEHIIVPEDMIIIGNIYENPELIK